MTNASLKNKISGLFTLIVVLICMIFGILFYGHVQQTSLANFTKQGALLAANLAYNSRYGVFSEDETALDDLVQGLMTVPEVVYVKIVNRKGDALSKNTREGEGLSKQGWWLLSPPSPQGKPVVLKNGKTVYDFSAPVIVGKSTLFPAEFMEGTSTSTPPDLTKIGFVHVGMSSHLLAQQTNRIVWMGVGIALVVLVIGIPSIWFFTSLYIQPLQTLASVARNITEGDFTQRIPVHRPDEIGELTRYFNQMSDSLSHRDQQILRHNETLIEMNTMLEERISEVTRFKETDLLKSEFIAHVSHEIRTPLTSIKGYLDNMRSGIAGALSEKQTGYVVRMCKNADRLIRLVNDLLDVSIIESGKMKMQRVALSLSDLVADVVTQFQPIAEARFLQIIFDRSLSTEKVQGDRNKLEQIVTNLLDNAIKFSPPGGSVAIQIRAEGSLLITSISDTGIGIPVEEQARIFDRFYRVYRTEGPYTEGTGLGLFIVKNLVEMQGGKIGVKSEAGKGSLFYFSLPLTE